MYTLLIQTVSYWTGWVWTDSRVHKTVEQRSSSGLPALPSYSVNFYPYLPPTPNPLSCAGGHKSWSLRVKQGHSRLTCAKNISKQSNNYYLWPVCTDCLTFNNIYDLNCIPSPFSGYPHTHSPTQRDLLVLQKSCKLHVFKLVFVIRWNSSETSKTDLLWPTL